MGSRDGYRHDTHTCLHLPSGPMPFRSPRCRAWRSAQPNVELPDRHGCKSTVSLQHNLECRQVSSTSFSTLTDSSGDCSSSRERSPHYWREAQKGSSYPICASTRRHHLDPRRCAVRIDRRKYRAPCHDNLDAGVHAVVLDNCHPDCSPMRSEPCRVAIKVLRDRYSFVVLIFLCPVDWRCPITNSCSALRNAASVHIAIVAAARLDKGCKRYSSNSSWGGENKRSDAGSSSIFIRSPHLPFTSLELKRSSVKRRASATDPGHLWQPALSRPTRADRSGQ